tara:strand:+ start:16726 stop:17259 length:534 start_codon:yes stop_codon:yes gene_type:complete
MLTTISKNLKKAALIFGVFSMSTAISAGTDTKNLNLAIVDTVMVQQYLVSLVDKSLEKDFKSRYDGLNYLAKEISEQQNKFRKEKDIMKQVAKDSLDKKIQNMQMEYQKKAESFEADLNARRSEEIRPKFEKILDTVKDLSRQENYDVVLTKTATLYVDNKYDITENVIKRFEEKNK